MKLYKVFLTVILSFSVSVAFAQKIDVTGKVTDEKGEPMPGVGVIDKNNPKVGTVTDLDGVYKIKVAKEGFLEFSFMSYENALVPVEGRKVVNVQMKPSMEQLEKVVVIGYGTSKKSDLTGAVSVVDADDLTKSPITSVAQALQGRVAGAEFMSTTGEPGEGANILVRGSRSISAGNQPLIVVDGVVDAVSDLSEINPSDIVSISVLKDVSSTAIYGSRGANGVILITTVSADKDDAKAFSVALKASAGVSQIASKLDILNAEEYAQWRNMVSKQDAINGGKDLATWNPPFADPAAYGKGTDWIDHLSQTGVYQDYHISLKGGHKDTKYSVSFGYHDNKGVVKSSGYKRYSTLAWIDSKLTKKLRWGMRVTYTLQDVDRSPAAIGGTNTNAAIFLSPLLTKDDVWNKYGDSASSGGVIFNNPLMSAEEVTSVAMKNATSFSPWLQYTIAKNVVAKTKFTYTYKNDFTGYYSPSYLPVAAANMSGGSASRADWKQRKYLSETTFTYTKKKKGHNLETLLGFTAEKSVTENFSVSGSGYVDDNLKYHNMAALKSKENITLSSYYNVKTSMSVLGRVNYSYKRRYYGTFTLRADGASNFAAGKKWGFFPAAAFRWSVSNESWLKNAHWLNDLSLRLSAGRSGNDAVSSYMSLATLTAANTDWLFGDSRELVYLPSKLENSNLTWETTDSYNLGLNFAVLNSRIVLEADAYISVTKDLLLSMKNSQTTGYSTYFTNAGKTRNAGVEISLTTQNIRNRNFAWTSILTMSHNRQMVVDVGNNGEIVPTYNNPRNSSQYMYGYKNGYPVNAIWGYKSAGVWKSEAEIERNKLTHTYVSHIQDGANGSNVGRSKFVDVNNDGLLDLNDMVYLGTGDPVIYGGFQNDFTIYKNLNVGFYFAYSLGGKMYNLSELWMGSTTSSYNKYKYILNAWDEEHNPDSDIPRAGYNDAFASDRQVHDASFLRLKSVSVSYTINFKKKIKKYVNSMTVGVSGENLILWKYYNGFDPDVSTSLYRLDNGSFPRPRTVVFNLSMNF
jgi:TonB-linked SusC/RagA family outer membrane protein